MSVGFRKFTVVKKKDMLPEMGSISDVANLYKYNREKYVPVDTSEYYPTTQKYENISLEYILSKKKHRNFLSASEMRYRNGLGLHRSNYEVNGALNDYYIELPKIYNSLAEAVEVLQPLKLPSLSEANYSRKKTSVFHRREKQNML